MHLVHAILELFQRFLLFVRKRAVQFLTVPGYEFEQFLEPFIATSALLEGGDVAVRSSYSDGRPFWRKSFITSPKIPYFSPALSPRYNSSKLICAISAPPLQYTTVPQVGAEVQRFLNKTLLGIRCCESIFLLFFEK